MQPFDPTYDKYEVYTRILSQRMVLSEDHKFTLNLLWNRRERERASERERPILSVRPECQS